MIHQLMFGGGAAAFSFSAVTSTGQFNYIEHPSGDSETQNYSASEMTTWFNNGSFARKQVPESRSGTLTVNFNFTVPSGYKLYLAAYMGAQMNQSLATIDLNGSQILSGWPQNDVNVFVASSGTSVSTMSFFCSVSGSGYNDGYVVRVENFVLVPNSASVSSNWNANAILANVSGAVATSS
jgi:hypothetical protein